MTATGASWACTSSQIDTGSGCEDAKFSVTTTSLTTDKTFKFVLSAAGTFYVDWGDGTVDPIVRTGDTTPTEYSHVFTSCGVKVIRFGGLATEYNTTSYADKDASGAATNTTSTNTSGTPTLIARLDGSIGSVFPTLGG